MKLAGKARWPPGEGRGLPLGDGSPRTPEAGRMTRSLWRRRGAPASSPGRTAVGGLGPVQWAWGAQPLLGSHGVVVRLRGPGWGQRRSSRWTCGCRENSKSGQPGWGAGRGRPCPTHDFPLPERPPRRPLHSPGVWLQLPLQPTLLFRGPRGGLGATLGLRGPQQGSGVAKTGRLVDGQGDAGSG